MSDFNFDGDVHEPIPELPETGPDGKYPESSDPEGEMVIRVTVDFKFFGRQRQAIKFVDRLQRRLNVEVDSSCRIVDAVLYDPTNGECIP